MSSEIYFRALVEKHGYETKVKMLVHRKDIEFRAKWAKLESHLEEGGRGGNKRERFVCVCVRERGRERALSSIYE